MPDKINRVWGLDLTFVTDVSGKQKIILGIIEHASRACLSLQALPSKHSPMIVLKIIEAVRLYGFPKNIRTDNERIFTGVFFTWALLMLGIQHQRTKLASPWMNGRVERFFGTLKGKLNEIVVENNKGLEPQLNTFRLWYNHIRPHYHLYGKTPSEVWSRKAILLKRKATFFSTWHGLLTGYYFEN